MSLMIGNIRTKVWPDGFFRIIQLVFALSITKVYTSFMPLKLKGMLLTVHLFTFLCFSIIIPKFIVKKYFKIKFESDKS